MKTSQNKPEQATANYNNHNRYYIYSEIRILILSCYRPRLQSESLSVFLLSTQILRYTLSSVGMALLRSLHVTSLTWFNVLDERPRCHH